MYASTVIWLPETSRSPILTQAVGVLINKDWAFIVLPIMVMAKNNRRVLIKNKDFLKAEWLPGLAVKIGFFLDMSFLATE
jgi:hypothetical protein